MRVYAILLVLLLGAAPLSAGQESSTAAVKEAQQAFSDALTRHDRAAFEQFLAADSVFLLPVATHGSDDIVKAWLPVLVDGRLTITLTAHEPISAGSGDLAYVTGSFSYRGQSGNGTAPTQDGEYVAVWRLIDGRWKIAELAGGPVPRARPMGGIGAYRFGMTLDDVRRVTDCQPYTNVPQTGGLECANYTFEGRTTNISFLFAAGRLRRLQLWMYEGGSESNAKDAVARVVDFLRRTTGGVVSRALPGGEVTAERVMDILSAAHPTPGTPFQFDLTTPANAQPEVWFARVGKVQSGSGQTGYLVLLLADPRQ